MLDKVIRNIRLAQTKQHIGLALARAASTSMLRQVDEASPSTWEFSGFSQNGEDGVIDFLTRKIKSPNHYFIEIGASNGLENNSSWLAIGRKFNGLMVEGNAAASAWCSSFMPLYNLGVESICSYVSKANVQELFGRSLFRDPDVFSLDIDSLDYYVVQEILKQGLRPKIVVVEYNSAYGPDQAVTVEYADNFDRYRFHASGLYYGASVMAFRRLLESHGYRFITVEHNGVNAFFVDPDAFDQEFLARVQGLPFAENFFKRQQFKSTWNKQFKLIEGLPLVNV